MNRGNEAGGYTIVELLIFLAVSAAMFVSTMALLGGRQARTEFQQSIGNFDSQIQDISNDVSTGYYSATTSLGGTIKCTHSSAGVFNFSSVATNSQGQSKDCIFIGKALQFAPSGSNAQAYNILTLVGGRTYASATGNNNSISLNESGIKAVSPDNTSNGNDINAVKKIVVDNGVQIDCVWYSLTVSSPKASKPCVDTAITKIDTVAFITTFAPISNSGNNSVELRVPVSATAQDRSLETAASAVDGFAMSSSANPKSGVYVCLQSSGSDQYAVVHIGGLGSKLATTHAIYKGSCS